MFTGQFAFERKRKIVVVPPSVHQEQYMDDRRSAVPQNNVRVQPLEANLPKFLLHQAQMEPGSCLE